ncbi:hypothetical protein N5D48_10195 [Pseudomonas sp. GD03858]|uniref:hypothetical protein n=1 Tax=unclassified Pseudomonas TaxID=196821 RepID=UPI002447A297|nr:MULTISPECIES: hypothetical protein [unclassified Pseudomonas]MDH0647647.1 hypothetical protein [Pseudomonas sp. GD03867]MDH0662773.1 hypothetical protein [Pseudomonas sp. GD03858]
MKWIAFFSVLAAAAPAQFVLGNEHTFEPAVDTVSPFAQVDAGVGQSTRLAGVGHYGGVAPFDCPPGTFATSVGHCQPSFDFD